jgi:hypothetical protein
VPRINIFRQIILNIDFSPEALFLFVLTCKKSFDNLFISNSYPVYSVKNESCPHYDLYSLIDIEHFCKKEKENAEAQVKHHHEDAEHRMKLLKHSVAVHQF